MGIAIGYLSAYIEEKQRTFKNHTYDRLLYKIQKRYPYRIKITIYRSLLELFLLGIILFMGGIYLIHYLLVATSSILPPSPLKFDMLWALSLTGGILSLRTKNSYIVLTSTFITMGIVLLVWQ